MRPMLLALVVCDLVGCRSGAITGNARAPVSDAAGAPGPTTAASGDQVDDALASIESVESRYDRRRQAFLATAKYLPASTPYDDGRDPALRRIYLDEYRAAFAHFTALANLEGMGIDEPDQPLVGETGARWNGWQDGKWATLEHRIEWLEATMQDYRREVRDAIEGRREKDP